MPITHLLFDLDGTLYPHDNGIWNAIASRMEEYMHNRLGFSHAEIPGIREGYYHQYGTTLKGLIVHHKIDPYEYLEYVHDVPLDQYLNTDYRLAGSLKQLPFPKWIFTNADVNHAVRVLAQLGISECFDGIIGVNSLGFLNKPDPRAFAAALKFLDDPNPGSCIFIDDIPKNLIAAKLFGMYSVLVGSTDPAPEIDQALPDIYHLGAAVDSIARTAI